MMSFDAPDVTCVLRKVQFGPDICPLHGYKKIRVKFTVTYITKTQNDVEMKENFKLTFVLTLKFNK